MKTWLVLVLGLFALCAPVAAQDAKARVSLGTQDEVWVGQRVTLVVELLAPGYFAAAASFQVPDAPGLLIIPPASSPTVSGETVGDIYYTVQRHEFAVFTSRGGAQTIPPISASFPFKRQPLDKNAVAATVETPPLTFTTKVPPGAEKLPFVISARSLTAVETWKPEPGQAKAGDAFTRTLTYTAPEVPAMAFPPFQPGTIDGLGIYPKAPEVLDQNDRGDLTGKRRDTIIYVCQRPGHFVIPAAKLTWFDLDALQLKTIDFPARTLEVAPNPALASAATAEARAMNSSASKRALLTALFAAFAANGLVLLAWKTRRVWQPVIDLFRPVHLAPLNPTERTP